MENEGALRRNARLVRALAARQQAPRTLVPNMWPRGDSKTRDPNDSNLVTIPNPEGHPTGSFVAR